MMRSSLSHLWKTCMGKYGRIYGKEVRVLTDQEYKDYLDEEFQRIMAKKEKRTESDSNR